MPTHAEKPAFIRDMKRLTPNQVSNLEQRLQEFVDDLARMEIGRLDWFRPGLRVKKVIGARGVYEMTWAPDGRATFAWAMNKYPVNAMSSGCE